MRVLRLVVILLAALFVAGRHLRERARLRRVEDLDGPSGLRYLEATRARSERTLLWLTVGITAAAVGSLIHLASRD